MKASHPLIHRRWSTETEDPYGNPEPAYAESTVLVYAWWVPDVEENIPGGRDATVADVRFLAPTFPVDDRDEFIIPAFSPKPLRVVGEAQPYDFGPFGFTPGMQVDLRFSEG